MQPYVPAQILVDSSVEGLSTTQRILNNFKNTTTRIVENTNSIKQPGSITEGKKTLFITRLKGQALKPCQGQGDYVCCNYFTISPVSNCHLECTYCILQDYLKNNPIITIYANIEEIMDQIQNHLETYPTQFFRIGTGELSDSLALDTITGFSKDLVPFAARQKNMILELKTKTNQIDNLLGLDHQRKTVISWSVNPQQYIEWEEHKSSSLSERLEAAQKIAQAGYPIGLHLDPLLALENWQNEYLNLFVQLRDCLNPKDIAWISMGSLRFTPGLKTIIKERFPRSRLLYGELYPHEDGKIRYFRGIREELYQHIKELIHKHFPHTPHYLCMETKKVWQQVYQKVPDIEEMLNIN